MENTSTKLAHNKPNLIFAILLAVLPLLVSFFDLITGEYITILLVLTFWCISYIVFLGISLFINALKGNLANIRIKLNFYTSLVAIISILVIISCIINNADLSYMCLYLSIPLIFICIYSLSSKQLNLILNVLLITLAICCIMGFIDPLNKFMPGFNPLNYQLSIQLGTSNFSGVVMASASIFAYLKFNESNKNHSIYYLVLYMIYMLFLFMNGSFAPITAVVIVQVFCIIFFSIKNKKLNFKFAILSMIAVALCFLVDLIPNIKLIRTCEYNYFLECVAVFDNIFNTNLLNIFGIDSIIGSDGWARSELLQDSLIHCTSSVKNFLFGSGPGAFQELRPHNILLTIWIDFGIFPTLLCVILFIYWIVSFLRSKNQSKQVILFITILTFFLANIVGSLVFYSAYILVIYISIFAKKQQYIATTQDVPQKR